MSEQERSYEERVERIDIVHELPPSAHGTYQYERKDGTWSNDEARP